MDTSLPRHAGIRRADVVVGAIQFIRALTDPLGALITDRAIVAIVAGRVDKLRGTAELLKTGIRRAEIAILTVLEDFGGADAVHARIHHRAGVAILAKSPVVDWEMRTAESHIACIARTCVPVVTRVRFASAACAHCTHVTVGAGIAVVTGAGVIGRIAPQDIGALVCRVFV